MAVNLKVRAAIRSIIQGILSAAALLLAWHACVVLFDLPAYLLPSPIDVLQKFWSDLHTGVIYPHFRITLIEVVSGFLLAVGLGVSLGTSIALIPFFERIIYPYILALETIPKIAIAPLFLIWFGYGIQSKIVTAGLIAFFPILINVIAGLKNTDENQLLLMRALKASTWQTYTKVRLPGMLPFLFAGFEVAIIFSLIGAIVGEFIGASSGLGSLIIQRQGAVDVAGVFSVLIYLSIMGLSLSFALKKLAVRFGSWTDEK